MSRQECLICCEKAEFLTKGTCVHANTCLECSYKHRSDPKNHMCIVCKKPTEKVFVIPNQPEWLNRSFQELARHKKSEFIYGMWSLNGISDKACAALKSLHCPVKNCREAHHPFVDLEALKRHMKEKHRRYFCELCLKHRILLVEEQQIYSKAQLARHMEEGDLSPEGEVISIHPKCPFCNRFYFDEAEFLAHMKTAHMKCHICKGPEFRYTFFKDYPSLRIHFDKTHYACQDKKCLAEAFVVFRTQAELQNHHENRHLGNTKSKGKEKSYKIRTVGTTEDIIIRDNKGKDVSPQLLSQRKAKKRIDGNDQTQWNRKFMLLDLFGLLTKIRHGETEAFLQQQNQRKREQLNKDFSDSQDSYYKEDKQRKIKPEEDLQGLLGKFRIFCLEELKRRGKGETWDEIAREDIRTLKFEKAKRRKEQKRKMKQKMKQKKEEEEEDSELVYKRQDQGKPNSNPQTQKKKKIKKTRKKEDQSQQSEDETNFQIPSQKVCVEDVIFKREVNGHQIDWDDFEERARKVLEYKALDKIHDLSLDFEERKISSGALFQNFESHFGRKHVFRFYYWYLLSLEDQGQRGVLSKNLFRELGRLRFRNHNILIKATYFRDIFMRLEDQIAGNVIKRAKTGSLQLRVGIQQDRLYQFFKSVKRINLDEALNLKFLNLYLSGYRALLVIQKAFFIETRQISRWLDHLSDLDALIGFVYFHLVNLKFEGKDIHMSQSMNPNLVKIFFKLHPDKADQFEIDPDSEDEDFTFIDRKIESQRRRQAKESARQAKRTGAFEEKLKEYNQRKVSTEDNLATVGKVTAQVFPFF